MFTGIIEGIGTIVAIEHQGTNVHFTLTSTFTNELKIDQSLAHNGVCLTVVDIQGDQYVVTAIQETLRKTTLSEWSVGDHVNLERAMLANGRFDGHVVQGHVDEVARCLSVEQNDGSWSYTFEYNSDRLTVEKGSITVNGVSLTVVDSKERQFSVAIIPYTHENTSFKQLKAGDQVNLEFDIVGKYVERLLSLRS